MIIELWQAGGQEEFKTGVREAIIDRLSYVDFDVEAESGISFEAEPMGAELLEVQEGTLTEPVVLAADEKTVTFSIDVTIKAKFDAVFSFAVWDSVDREYVGMGSESAVTTDEVTLSPTIVADRDVSKGIQHQEISVSHEQFTVDFGYVDAFLAEELDDRY